MRYQSGLEHILKGLAFFTNLVFTSGVVAAIGEVSRLTVPTFGIPYALTSLYIELWPSVYLGKLDNAYHYDPSFHKGNRMSKASHI